MDYRGLNANVGAPSVAVLNTAELTATIKEHAHKIMATTGIKDMFFMVPLQESD